MGTLTNSRSFIFGDSNWKFSKIGYPIGPQKPDIQMWTFLILYFFFFFFLCFYFLVKKIKTCWIYKNTVFTNWRKYKVTWNFCFGVYYWFLKLYTGINWHSKGFHSERAAAGLQPGGLTSTETIRFIRDRRWGGGRDYIPIATLSPPEWLMH